MRLRDILDHLRLRRLLENPRAYWALKRSRSAGPEMELRFRAGYAFYLRPASHDAHRFHRIFLKDEYRVRDLGEGLLSSVLDVGANAGLFAARVASLAREVHCFEPVPANFGLLERNLAQDAFRHVHLHPVAVTGGARTQRIYLSRDPGCHSGLLPVGDEYVEVEGLPLEEFIRETPISRCDLLKMDCEGAEYSILYSLSPGTLGRIRRIHMEYHEVPPGSGDGWNPDGLTRYLAGHGYRVDHRSSRRSPGFGWLFASRA